MLGEVNILWIKPREIQLKLVPGKNAKQIPLESRILSYDVQSNYPITPLVEAIRQLQSGYKGTINPAILNLSAVPRSQFIESTWQKDYLSKIIKKVPFGSSQIETRYIRKDISEIPELGEIINKQDLVVVTSPFEMNINEIKQIGKKLKDKYKDILLMASGIGTETREELLLKNGFDLVFTGTVTDRGEKVVEALINKNIDALINLPGVYTNLSEKSIRNPPARGFKNSNRQANVGIWKKTLPSYFKWKPLNIKFIGRNDLKKGLPKVEEPSFESYCAFQDLPHKTLTQLSKAGEKLIIGATDISISIGCFRNDCNFCASSGKGYAIKDVKYVLSIIKEYHSKGITDIIPTDDALLIGALHPNRIKDMIKIFKKLNDYQISLFPGNGISTYSFSKIIEKSKQPSNFGKQSQEFLDLFLKVVPYFYLPVERLYAITGEKTNEDQHNKLQDVRKRFCDIIKYISEKTPREKVEIATNIMFSPTPNEQEIKAYYEAMNKLVIELNLPKKVNIRYVGFFTIPSNGAAHIEELTRKHNLEFAQNNPELKVVSVPIILNKKETTTALEQRLKFNIKYRDESNTGRRLIGGTYYEN